MASGQRAALDDVSNRFERLKAGQSGAEGVPVLEGRPVQDATAPPQKLVIVPIRKRSTRGAAAAPVQPAEPAALSCFRQVNLPATPPPGDDDEPQPTPADKGPDPRMTDQQATTPLAAEVLAGLVGLGALAHVAADAAERGSPPDESPHRQLSGSSAAGERAGSVAVSVAGAAASMEQRLDAVALDLQPRPSAAAAAAGAAATAAAAAAAFGPGAPLSRPKASSSSQEASGRKGCNCKRSMCLKMYCECFAAGGYCAPGCACANCYNHESEAAVVQKARQVVLAKDPKAFETKVTASEGHKRGCRCKRSKCLKKYCECFHAGAKCNPDVCQCEGCRNTDEAAGAATHVSSLSLEPESIAMQGLQGGPAVLHALAGILPQLDTPEASTNMDSTGDNQALVAGGAAAAPLLPASVPMPRAAIRLTTQQQQPAAPHSSLPGPAPRVAFAGFPLPPGFPQAADSNGAATLPPAPFLVGPAGMVPGLFHGMPPFFFNPVTAATLAAAAAASSQQQQQAQQLLPIAPLQSSRAAMAASEGNAAPAGEEASLLGGDEAVQAAAAVVQSQEPSPMPAAAAPAMEAGAEASADAGTCAVSEPGRLLRKRGSVALTEHLSEVLGALDPDMRDTATSPAPHVAASRLPTMAATLTGRGGRAARAVVPAQPAAASRAGSEERSAVSSRAGSESAGSPAESSQRSKRPRRAASGGVMGAVAAEAAAWGEEWASPPKRASAAQAGGVSNRAKVAGRFALLKKALEAETMHAQKRARGCAPAPRGNATASIAADEEDVISALFELSSSVC